MLRRLVLVALIAGVASGAVATIGQALLVWPLIERAEAIEAGHNTAAPVAPAHDHGPTPGAPIAPGWLTAALANIIVGVGFALLLAGAMLLARDRGGIGRGLLWGGGGFLAFVAAPALILPALPPGVEAGDLTARQLVWLGTALATAGGLLLAVFARGWMLRVLGLALIVAPHALVLLGLPGLSVLPAMDNALAALRPSYLLGLFIAAACFWAALGGVAGGAWTRLAKP